ncbi:DUF397 domain-containing protein [Streptomyces sp. 21So2-11]|uniref:DUF397 domain-containing protein n=1 Tax=Streptomyces sp. 21So2-11 TaxID=3144408 RepID=UPI00321AEA3A
MKHEQPSAPWVKSSYSGPEGGNCLEWAPTSAALSGLVPVRDSKAPERPALVLSADAWTAFLPLAKAAKA